MKELKAAKERLQKETCIVELIRKLRFIEQIFELVTTEEEKNDLIAESKQTVIEMSPSKKRKAVELNPENYKEESSDA